MNHREAGPALAAIPARTRPRARTTGEDCVHGGSAGRGGPCGHAQRCGAPGGRDISEHSHLVARADEHGVDGPTLDPASCVCTEGSSSLMRVDGGGTARKLRCAAHLERQLCDMQLQMLNGRSGPTAPVAHASGVHGTEGSLTTRCGHMLSQQAAVGRGESERSGAKGASDRGVAAPEFRHAHSLSAQPRQIAALHVRPAPPGGKSGIIAARCGGGTAWTRSGDA
jgi:hypothetical protein